MNTTQKGRSETENFFQKLKVPTLSVLSTITEQREAMGEGM